MAFTATGDTLNPSAGYAPIDANAGVGAWNVVPGGAGAAQDDGFTSYKSQVGNPPRTRWGDYGAAAVDGNSIWIASEYIAACVRLRHMGRPVLRRRHGRQPAGHVCRPSPRRRARGPRSATGRLGSASSRRSRPETGDDWRAGRKVGPLFVSTTVCPCVLRWRRSSLALLIAGAAQATPARAVSEVS